MERKNYFELKTPDLGDTDKIELIQWYIRIGDSISKGQEILELVTDKAAFPVEAPNDGRLTEIRIPAGSIVQKYEILGVMELVS